MWRGDEEARFFLAILALLAFAAAVRLLEA